MTKILNENNIVLTNLAKNQMINGEVFPVLNNYVILTPTTSQPFAIAWIE